MSTRQNVTFFRLLKSFGTIVALIILAGFVLQADAAIRKGPYLIYPGSNTQMTVLWQLTNTQGCTLKWGEDTGGALVYNHSIDTTEYGGDHQHKHTITNLKPGFKCNYRLTVGANEYAGSFRAAPESSADNVKFLAYGDTRSNPDDHETVTSRMLETFTNDRNYQTFTIHDGDWVKNGDSESDWDNEFFNRAYPDTLAMQANLALQGCMGNHEYSGAGFSKYLPYPFVDPGDGLYWSFDYGPVHIVMLDQFSYGDYDFSPTQLAWLKNDLASSNKQWKFLVFHAPGWSAGHSPGHEWWKENNVNVQTKIQPLCKTYGVDIVFNGHFHYYARCDVNGVQHVTTAGGGAPFHPGAGENPEYLVSGPVSEFHFCKIDIHGNQLDFTAIKADDGTVIDSFTISHSSSPNSLLITEFLAVNNNTAMDKDGDFSDWIEIFNSGMKSVSLYRWCLTDDSGNLEKWRFSSVEIGPGAFLRVFASGKDRAVAGSGLHTNFTLSESGEYLALVKPDGVTVAHEYAPQYPAQTADVSYGLKMQQSQIGLIVGAATAKVHVPTDGSLGLDWIKLGFDDTGWTSGPTGIGYGSLYSDLIATDIETLMDGVNDSAYVRMLFDVNNPAALKSLRLRMKYGGGFVAYLNGQEVTRRNAPEPVQWSSSATAVNSQSRVYEDINISEHLSLLQSGRNILAIHGLKVAGSAPPIWKNEYTGTEPDTKLLYHFNLPDQTASIPIGMDINDAAFTGGEGFSLSGKFGGSYLSTFAGMGATDSGTGAASTFSGSDPVKKIECWVKIDPDAFDGSGNFDTPGHGMQLARLDNAGGSGECGGLIIDTQNGTDLGALQTTFNWRIVERATSDTLKWQKDIWYHLVYEFRNSGQTDPGVKFYRDGQLISYVARSTTWSARGDITWGNHHSPSVDAGLQGLMDEFRVSNSAFVGQSIGSNFLILPELGGGGVNVLKSEVKFFREPTPGARNVTLPFSIVALPDTQIYVKSDNLMKGFFAQTNWVKDNVTKKNIIFVIHFGDMVTYGGQNDTSPQNIDEWNRAKDALSVLDGVVPWYISVGNHELNTVDYVPSGFSVWRSYFGPSTPFFAGKKWFIEASPSENSSYQVVSIGGREFLFLHLELNAPGYIDDPGTTLGWAKTVMDANPDKPTILINHTYYGGGGAPSSSPYGSGCGPEQNSGQTVWNKLISKHSKIFMTFSGHYGDPTCLLESTNDAGKKVYQVKADFSNRANGGDGWMLPITFDDDAGEIRLEEFTPGYEYHLGNPYPQTGDSFTLKVNFAERFDGR